MLIQTFLQENYINSLNLNNLLPYSIFFSKDYIYNYIGELLNQVGAVTLFKIASVKISECVTFFFNWNFVFADAE